MYGLMIFFKNGPCPAHFCLRVHRCAGDAQRLDGFIRDARRANPFEERRTVSFTRLDETQRSMADGAEEGTRGVGLGDFFTEYGGLTQVEGRTPPTGEEDNIVLSKVDGIDFERVLDCAEGIRVGDESFLIGSCNGPTQHAGLKGDGPALDARDIHPHSGIQELIVGMQEF